MFYHDLETLNGKESEIISIKEPVTSSFHQEDEIIGFYFIEN